MALDLRDKKFGRIGVLMGGPSREREISLRSGAGVLAALKESGLDVVGIDIKSDRPQENIDLVRAQKLDCAFLALHGRFGEDGGIQAVLDSIELPYTGSGAAASRLAMDKSLSLDLFRKRGLCVPDYQVMEKDRRQDARQAAERFGFPLVIKPANEGSSIGLSIIHHARDLDGALDLAFGSGDKVVIGEYIRGREFTVGILDEKTLPVVEIIPKKEFFDYEAKYSKGMTDYEVPARVNEDAARNMQGVALSAHLALGCFGCSRVDIILGEHGQPYILEVNTIPGMTATSLLPKAALCAGISYGELCLKLISSAYEKK